MTTTTYIYPELSSFQFPGGEHTIKGQICEESTQVFMSLGASADDLVSALMWADLLKSTSCDKILLLPYLPGARQDRDIPFGAKVYSELINQVGANRVLTFDPHSPVMPGLVNNIEVVPMDRVLLQIKNSIPNLVGVIAPDKGATVRGAETAQLLGVPVYQGLKHRDMSTGKLSGFSVEKLPEQGDLLIVDDICDGGGTFVGLAEAAGIDTKRIHLWTTHGIYSKGVEFLLETFGSLHCTDSHPGSQQLVNKGSVYPVALETFKTFTK